MPPITTSEIQPISNNIIARATVYQRRATIMPKLVRNFRLSKGENRLDLPSWPRTHIRDLVEGQDMADAQDFTPTVESFTTAEAGAQVILTDRAQRQAREDVRRAAGEDLGAEMAIKIDTDIQSHFDLFTVNTLGSDTTDLELKHLLAARALITAAVDQNGNAKEPAPMAGKISAVVHTFSGLHLQQSIAWPGANNVPDDFQNKVLGKYWVGRSFGMDVFEGPYLPVASDAAKGSVFHERALLYLVAAMPRLEPERDASLRAWELNLVADFGHGMFKDAWGAELHVKADASV